MQGMENGSFFTAKYFIIEIKTSFYNVINYGGRRGSSNQPQNVLKFVQNLISKGIHKNVSDINTKY